MESVPKPQLVFDNFMESKLFEFQARRYSINFVHVHDSERRKDPETKTRDRQIPKFVDGISLVSWIKSFYSFNLISYNVVLTRTNNIYFFKKKSVRRIVSINNQYLDLPGFFFAGRKLCKLFTIALF